jgi:hypothetical protein
MKLRMFALLAILAFAAWLPDAAQQSPASRTAAQSQASAATTSPEKDAAANRTCACCDHAKPHGDKSAADHQAQACCHGKDVASMTCCHRGGENTKAVMNCCNGKDAKTSAANDGKPCGGAGNGKPCCEAKDSKPCCGNDAMACNSKDAKGCCSAGAEHCCASAHAK